MTHKDIIKGVREKIFYGMCTRVHVPQSTGKISWASLNITQSSGPLMQYDDDDDDEVDLEYGLDARIEWDV